jgi:hypothetical protein
MQMVKAEDEAMLRLAAKEKLNVLSPELKTHPRVYYKNLYRFENSFIAGSVAVDLDGVVDCVQGASVNLKKEDMTVAEMKTDEFGDFKFDYLGFNSGTYELEIVYNEFEKKTISVEVTKSQSITDIVLS